MSEIQKIDTNEITLNDVRDKIVTIQNKNVLLDSDVAWLYGVETREINQAIKNNPGKFPEGYIIQLDKDEWSNLKSKLLTSSWGGKNKLPRAFTEKGLYMLATILKSPQATQTTLAIIETFAKIRELTRTVGELAEKTTKEEKEPLMKKSGEIISDILGDSLNVSETETTFEVNLAVMNLKHTVRKKFPPHRSNLVSW